MPYATLQQMTDRFGEQLLLQLTDRATPPVGGIDPAVVTRVLEDTDAVIDGHLAGRYALPLAAVPPRVVDLALTIAIYKLHPYEPDPKITRDYEQAMKALLAISRGDERLPLEGAEPAAIGNSGVVINDRERPFTEDNMKGFI